MASRGITVRIRVVVLSVTLKKRLSCGTYDRESANVGDWQAAEAGSGRCGRLHFRRSVVGGGDRADDRGSHTSRADPKHRLVELPRLRADPCRASAGDRWQRRDRKNTYRRRVILAYDRLCPGSPLWATRCSR